MESGADSDGGLEGLVISRGVEDSNLGVWSFNMLGVVRERGPPSAWRLGFEAVRNLS